MLSIIRIVSSRKSVSKAVFVTSIFFLLSAFPSMANEIIAINEIRQISAAEQRKQAIAEDAQLESEQEQKNADADLTVTGQEIKKYEADLSKLEFLIRIYAENQWPRDQVLEDTEESIKLTKIKLDSLRGQFVYLAEKSNNALETAQAHLKTAQISVRKIHTSDVILRTGYCASELRHLYGFSDLCTLRLKIDHKKQAAADSKTESDRLMASEKFDEAIKLREKYADQVVEIEEMETRKIQTEVFLAISIITLIATIVFGLAWLVRTSYDKKSGTLNGRRLISKISRTLTWFDEELIQALSDSWDESIEKYGNTSPWVPIGFSIKIIELSIAAFQIWTINLDPLNTSSASSQTKSSEDGNEIDSNEMDSDEQMH
jgi:hypothetical protein